MKKIEITKNYMVLQLVKIKWFMVCEDIQRFESMATVSNFPHYHRKQEQVLIVTKIIILMSYLSMMLFI